MTSNPQEVRREETCNLASARRIAAMLDLEPEDLHKGLALPRGWQFFMLGADTPRSALRADGFPGLGVPMPDLGLPRLMLGGRTVTFEQDIPIGADVMRMSSVESVVTKQNASGPMAMVTLKHALRIDERPDPALVETQTYLLLPQAKKGVEKPLASRVEISAERTKTVTPDETLLFQYSALGFNSHRIHLDRDHARNVEGFPELVVNGGLATLMLTEFLRNELHVVPASFKTRHVAPLYCNRPIILAANRSAEGWRMQAFDDSHQLAVDMEVKAQ